MTKSSSFARMALGVSSLAYSGAWWAPETERFNSRSNKSAEKPC